MVEDQHPQLLRQVGDPCEGLLGDRVLLRSLLLLQGLLHLPLQLHHLLLLLPGVLVPAVAVPQEPTVRAVSAQVAVAHLFAQGTLL